MLSIGKVGMARGQQLYYEEQVAKGREDYYAGKGEAPGRWTGRGAELLGLESDLDVEQLKAMMDGRHPGTGELLARRSGNASTAAIDMTFSAPKSVSVLFTIGDPELSQALVDAHEAAVDAALAYMEDVACRVRRGHNGTQAERDCGDPRGWERARSEPADGFVAAAYRHRMSRAQDPQLHTHVVAANIARGKDGRWTALDAKHMYEQAKAAGSLYQAQLRLEVRERVPWASWGRERHGMAELEQVPEPVLREFSTRRNRILEREQELIAAGVPVGDVGRERIAFDTREAKREVDERDWRAGIRARAAEHGFGREELDELALLPAAPTVEKLDEAELAASLFGPGGLTARVNTFGERDVVIAVAAAAGQGLDVASVRDMSHGMLMDSPEVVGVPAHVSQRLFSTRELIEAERTIVNRAASGRDQGVAQVGEVEVLMAFGGLERPPTLEQELLVVKLAGSGNRIDTVEALAGTGKTTCAAALRSVYERAGYRVVGAAPTGRAMRELKEQAGIDESRTIDGWLVKLDNDADALRGGGPRGSVLILDEAGMASTRLSARLLEAADRAGAKVIAFGDSGQLASVQAGGWFGAITRQLGSFELTEVMRQRDPQERRGLAKVHRGEPESYLRMKASRGELTVFAGEQSAVDAERGVIERWAKASDEFGPDQAVMICRDNDRRERLNELAREHLKERGELGEGVEIAGREWSVGDRVIARRNDRRLDVDNGTRGTIRHAHPTTGLVLTTDSGRTLQIDPEYASGHLEHAYALTGHGIQGGTVEWAAVIGRPADFSRNWSYTALSRARQPTEILLVDELSELWLEREEIAPVGRDRDRDPVGRMGLWMRERDDEDLALEQLDRAEPLQTGTPATISALREPLYELRERLRDIHVQLAEPVIEQATRLEDVREAIARLEAERARDPKPGMRRDRPAHKYRAETRDRALADFREQEASLAEHVHNPSEVLKRADELRQTRGQLLHQSGELRARAVGEELDQRPVWLAKTLGPEPTGHMDRSRWQRTAREIASHRIEQKITDPTIAIDEHAASRSLLRSISDTRTALGLEMPGPDKDRGIGM